MESGRGQLLADGLMIVDFPIVVNHRVRQRVDHRLVAGLADVDDGQPCLRQSQAKAVRQHLLRPTLIVRPPVIERRAHAHQQGRQVDVRSICQNAGNAAHAYSLSHR